MIPRNGPRLEIDWSVGGISDMKSIDRSSAHQILRCIDKFLENGVGDEKKIVLLFKNRAT